MQRDRDFTQGEGFLFSLIHDVEPASVWLCYFRNKMNPRRLDSDFARAENEVPLACMQNLLRPPTYHIPSPFFTLIHHAQAGFACFSAQR